ncbi:MAG: VWA domain-containing protein [Deltaproteobacteria bacterium]|jgi:Ca-activated chloride channel family protein|nr:VWA domain-containing protein [Deltaproteobacteria bacterium]
MWRWQAGLGAAVAAAVGLVAAPEQISTGQRASAPVDPMDPMAPLAGWGAPPKTADPIATRGASASAGPVQLRARLAQGARLLHHDEDQLLVIEISADGERAARQPVHLSLVVDGSGSMKEQGRLSAAKAAAQALTAALRPEDSLSVVRFDDHADIVLAQRPLLDPSGARARLSGLRAAGGTNLYAGLQTGLGQLTSATGPGVRQLVLLSDGYANVGVTDGPTLTALARGAAQRGLSLSAFGVGWEFNEDLLAQVADAGGGRYRYAAQLDRLPALVEEAMAQAATQVARGTTVEVQLPFGEIEEVYGWGVDRAGQGLVVQVGDLAAGETRKVVLRVNLDERHEGEVLAATARLRYGTPAGAAQTAEVAVYGLVTADPTVVAASMDAEAAALAAEARGAALLQRGAADFAAGDLPSNQARLAEAAALLADVGARRGDAGLLEAAAEVERQRQAYQSAPPATAAGQDLLKRSKEDARAWSR